jgi:glycosyltransferase involved in cell wall biosynthesis
MTTTRSSAIADDAAPALPFVPFTERRCTPPPSLPALPFLSVVVPFHAGLPYLARSLRALAFIPGAELIVVADGAVEDCRALAGECGAQVIGIDGPAGPAAARNRGAAAATGDVLVFVDADVVVWPDALRRIAELLAQRPAVDAVFGSYDDRPAASNFLSQYRNLLHCFTHQTSNHDAFTFWAGLGAVRADVFRAMGGFSEQFGRPSIEDIELGYRLRASGHQVALDRRLHGTHLKRWTLRSMLVTDLRDRGVPWMRLILRSAACPSDLNLSHAARVSIVLSYLLLLSLIAAITSVAWLAPALVIGVLFALANRRVLSFMIRKRGWRFGAGVGAVVLLFHLINGISVLAGTALHLAERWRGGSSRRGRRTKRSYWRRQKSR